MALRRPPVIAAALASTVLLACTPPGARHHRTKPADYHVALGDITHSSPVLTPLRVPEGNNRRLDFGELRDEDALHTQVQSANLTVDDATATFQEIALALAYAGDQVSESTSSSSSRRSKRATEASRSSDINTSVTQESTRERGETPTSRGSRARSRSVAEAESDATTESVEDEALSERSSARGYSTPELPALGEQITADPTIQGRLAALLERAERSHALTPDDAATIVASLKLYMVGLEDFFNATALWQAADSGISDWLPYRMSFVVTVEPGWFTQHGDYDAVAEIELGGGDDVRIINAIPPQTAQAIDQFTAAFRSLGASLGASGSYNRIAARAAVRRLKLAARRLQGMRTNTTFSASFPADNRLRLRFHASMIADARSSTHMQPTSRVVTATILVRKPTAGGRPNAPLNKPSTNSFKEVEERLQKGFSRPSNEASNQDAPQPSNERFKKEAELIPTLHLRSQMWFESAKNHRLARPRRDLYCVDAKRNKSSGESCTWTDRGEIEAPSWQQAKSSIVIEHAAGEYWAYGASTDFVEGALHLKIVSGSPLETYQVVIHAPGVSLPEGSEPITKRSGDHVLPLKIDPKAVGDAREIHGYIRVSVADGARSDEDRAAVRPFILNRLDSKPPAPAAPAPPSKPTNTIKRGEVTLTPLPLADIPVDLLRALLGDRLTLSILDAAGKGAPAKTPNTGTRSKAK